MFRFSIRDVLWLTVVVGLAVGWWMDHAAADRRYRMLERNVILMSGRGGLILDGR